MALYWRMEENGMTGREHGPSRSWMTFIPGKGLPPEPEPLRLPQHIAEPAERMLHDLQGSNPIPISLGYRPDAGGSGPDTIFVTVANCSYGFGIDPAAPLAEQLVAIADGIQEHLAECPAAWGEARPRCPGHPHPAVAKLDGDAAYWACPTDGHRLGLVGDLR